MRIHTVGSFAAILAVAAGTFAAPAASPLRSPSSWTQFRLFNSNNAVVPGTLSVSWRTQTGAPFSSSPALVDGILYVGDNGGALYALDPATGKVRWTARASKPLMSAPIVYGDDILVGEGDESSPAAATPAHPMHVGGKDSALLAFDRRSGALRWRIPLPGSGMPTGAIVAGIFVHHDGAGELYGVDPQSGRVLYTKNLHSIASMSAALPLDATRFASLGVDANALWVLDAKNGAVVQHTTFPANASGFGDCPPVGDSKAVFCDYVVPPTAAVPMQTQRQAVERAFAVQPMSGKRLWDVELERGSLPIRNEAAIPLLAYGTLYAGSSVAPFVHALDPASGALRWRAQTHGPVLGGMVAVNGTLYLGDLGGYLWALNARTGRVVGDVNEGTPFNVGSPIVAGQTLIVGSRGGTILAVPLSTIRDTRD